MASQIPLLESSSATATGRIKSFSSCTSSCFRICCLVTFAVGVVFVFLCLYFLTGTHNASIPCPGSPSLIHASCALAFRIDSFSCEDVQEEVERRLQGKDKWKDPKSHPGTYALLESKTKTNPRTTLGTRVTGDEHHYLDRFYLTYTNGDQEKGCTVTACSESQSTSVYDYSTNFCNVRNLLCGKKEQCKISRHDLPPMTRVDNSSCRYHDVQLCFR